MRKNTITIFLLLASFALITTSCQGQMDEETVSEAVSDKAVYGAEVGDKAYNFTLQDLEGNTISLSDYQSKEVVLLVFSTTRCVYCRTEIPELNRLEQEYGNQAFSVLSVFIKESKSTVSAFCRRNNAQYKVLLDADGSVAQDYKVYGIPLNVLIDKEGIIQYRGHLPREGLDDLIEDLIE